jgi:hypothetical protein
MIIDSVLIGIALVAGIIGTLWEHPPKLGKIALIALLLTSSVAAIYKAVSDDKDKELLQQLVISGLALPNSAYSTVYREMSEAYAGDKAARCHHTHDGMTCFLRPREGQPARTFVFNRYEIAQIYADAVRGRDTKGFLKEIADKRYEPKHPSDEYLDKIGILEMGTFFDMCHRYPEGYDYDPTFGVKVLYDNGQKQISLTPEDVITRESNLGLILFARMENLFRTKIHDALPNCS